MNLKIKRLENHGIVVGVIEDLKIVPLLAQNLTQDAKQKITPGEAVKCMIMNGLGFSNRPLSLSPQIFTNYRLNIYFEKVCKPSILIDINSDAHLLNVLILVAKAYFHRYHNKLVILKTLIKRSIPLIPPVIH
jgi:hypothetical protein